MLDATYAISEPQHGRENLQAVNEHGGEWVVCNRCGRQWSVNGSHAEIVTDGDGYCDDNAEES